MYGLMSLSYRVWARLQSLSLANMFSTLWRCLHCVLQKVAGELRRRLGRMQGVMPITTSRPSPSHTACSLVFSPPWFARRYGAQEPPFQQARRRPVSFEMCRIDHQRIGGRPALLGR